MPRAAKTTPPRRRLDAATAREVILDAAEKRLIVVGPSGIRLQEVAADAGVSHPTVLHHFGSRELLVKAVIARARLAITATLIEAIKSSTGGEGQLEAMLEGVAASFEKSGHARVIFWLMLDGHPMDGTDLDLSDVVDAAHTLRLTQNEQPIRPTRDDTARTIVLGALALIGGAVLGAPLLENAGLGKDPSAGVQFRRWLAGLMRGHLDGPSV